MTTDTLLSSTIRTATSALIGSLALLAIIGGGPGTDGTTGIGANPSADAPMTRDVQLASFVAAGPDAPGCRSGFVWRDARDGDGVCVTPAERDWAHAQNAAAALHRQPGGGAYGPLTCRPGYVWRDAWNGDGVCVTPFERDVAHRQNALGPSRSLVPAATPPAGRPSPQPTPPPAPSDDSRNGGLLTEVRRELGAMRQSHYQHSTDVREATGEYYYDCSGFLDYALQRSAPAALQVLPVSKDRPLAKDVVHHLQRVAAGGVTGPWRSVGAVRDLRPGDVVSWLTPEDSDSLNTGHIMIVLESPVPNPNRSGEWLVKVSDSTSSPHAADSRGAGRNGLGTGTIGLVTDGSGRANGYYWRGGVSTELKHTTIALGRVR